MQVQRITNQQPIFFRAGKVSKPSVLLSANLKTDTFVRNNNFNLKASVEVFHNKLAHKMGIVSALTVQKQVKRISEQTNITENETLYLLKKLTEYSGYKNLKFIEDELKKRNIQTIHNPDIFLEEGISTKEPCLNSVLSYVFKRNLQAFTNYPNPNYNKAIILDSVLLKEIEKLPKDKYEKFLDTMKINKISFIYLKDFENGYNIFNQNENLDNFAINLIKKAQENNQNDLKNNIDDVLNKEIFDLIEKLGLTVDVINPQAEEKISSAYIANKINPILPDSKEFIDFINKNSRFCGEETEQSKKYIFKFLNEMLTVITPKQYSDYLKTLHAKINKFILDNNKNPENIFYAIPAENKSFIVANYQYKKVNNLENLKYVYPKNNVWANKAFDLSILPENSTLIVLDDCSITGLSLANEVFPYKNLNFKDAPKDLSIIISPIAITKEGQKNIKSIISLCDREKNDKIIYQKRIPNWENSVALSDKKYLDMEYANDYVTSFILPYMGPDTNCEFIGPLLKKFFYSPKAQKFAINNLDFTLDLL